jgi:hypothetical protein
MILSTLLVSLSLAGPSSPAALQNRSAEKSPPAGATAAETTPVKARTHLLVADVVRVDLRRRVVVVQTGEPAAEMQLGVDEGRTRVSSGGRAMKLEDVRAGDRVSVSCSDDAAGGHVARLIVIRPRSGALTPAPAAHPTPEPPRRN